MQRDRKVPFSAMYIEIKVITTSFKENEDERKKKKSCAFDRRIGV